ncbi:hypothetical protein DFQ08_102775 [Winogradskyella arenosi]|uniref:Uncharacterized protein n=1 Tax=Winogradskyella arenosi TaxID=533325 RepID=A0A368ZHR1_9FLAO|nr:hypothetical protein DFQ08_102775 [Winogradskyella arenosi]
MLSMSWRHYGEPKYLNASRFMGLEEMFVKKREKS